MVGISNIVPDTYVNVLEHVKLKKLKSIVPAVIENVVQLKAAGKLVVPEPLLITTGPNVVFPFGVMLPVPTMVAVKFVNVPPLDNDTLFKFKFVAAITNAVEPKSSLLNQLAVVNVAIAVPLPDNDKFGELVAEPPVVPKTYVLVIDASETKPPVPVQVKPVASLHANTAVVAVVCANMMLPTSKFITRVFPLLETN